MIITKNRSFSFSIKYCPILSCFESIHEWKLLLTMVNENLHSNDKKKWIEKQKVHFFFFVDFYLFLFWTFDNITYVRAGWNWSFGVLLIINEKFHMITGWWRSSHRCVNISYEEEAEFSHRNVSFAFLLPDCVRLTRLHSLWINNTDGDDDEGICWACMRTGERMSGCSRTFGTLFLSWRSSKFSFVIEDLIVNKRRWISSSSAHGLIVTSGCSKIRSSLWDVGNCRALFDGKIFLNDERKEKIQLAKRKICLLRKIN